MSEPALRTSILVRLLIVAGLGVILLIPALFVSLLISDRQHTRSEAAGDVSATWGSQQTILGPILTIPVRQLVRGKNGEMQAFLRYVYVLPETLSARVHLRPEVRYRGIFRVPVYTADLTLDAIVDPETAARDLLTPGEVVWKDAFLTFGVTDLKGIQSIDAMTWDQRQLTPEPGAHVNGLGTAAFIARPSFTKGSGEHHVVLRASIRGTEEFRVVPVGRETRLEAASAWGDPSFTGDFLPTTRHIESDHFQATWRVLDVNRNLPQTWVGDFPDPTPPSFGVRLFLPVDQYQKTERALKYAIMFITLTFLTFFMVDVLAKHAFHPVHYLLVGLALVLFYVLLISLSEYILFTLAYVIAAAAIVLLITFYTYGVTQARSVVLIVGGALIPLYGFLFILLQLQDYALLIGSLGLFAVLALVMYLTRKIDWFDIGTPNRPRATT
jgi:inner membrane protein